MKVKKKKPQITQMKKIKGQKLLFRSSAIQFLNLRHLWLSFPFLKIICLGGLAEPSH